MTHWTAQYLGIKWQTGGREVAGGLDCWGLLMHVYMGEFGLFLPPFTGHVDGPKVFQPLLEHEVGQELWQEVAEPQEGDAVAIGRGETLSHVGVYTFVDSPCILHIPVNGLSVIVPIRTMKRSGWSNIKFYRHALRDRN